MSPSPRLPPESEGKSQLNVKNMQAPHYVIIKYEIIIITLVYTVEHLLLHQ